MSRTNHGAEIPATVEPPKVRSCNRHADCDEAEIKRQGHIGYIPNFHCHDDCCEDCFGQ